MRIQHLLGAAVAGALLAGTAFAGVTNTRHDMGPSGGMNKTVGGVTGRGVCSYCHVPHGAKGQRLWAGSPATGYTPVANLCFTCHGTGSAVTDSAQVSRSMFLTGNVHAFDRGTLAGTPKLNQGQTLATSGMPYATGTYPPDGTMGGDQIDCTSCHDVHNGTYRPFLRATLTAFCQTCHGGRETNGLGAANTNGAGFSNHPVGATYVGSTTRPIAWTTKYQVPIAAGQSVPASTQWYLGGHRTSGATGGVTCATCHEVHGSDPQTTYGGNGGTAPGDDLLVNIKFATTVGGADVCVDCHGNDPGATSHGHPVASGVTRKGSVTTNDLVVVAQIPTASLTSPSGVYSSGVAGPVCLSCHDTHFGQVNSPILADLGTFADNNDLCKICHTGTIITNREHHPATDAAATTYEEANWRSFAVASGTDATTTLTGGYSATLDCTTCHRAHNAANQNITGRPYDFALRGLNWSTVNAGYPTSAACMACHTANPGSHKYALGQAGEYGSHVVSAANAIAATALPTNATQPDSSWQPGLQTNGLSGQAYPPIRVTNWPQGTLSYAGSGNLNSFSKQGNKAFSFTAAATNSQNGGMLCESCHSVTNPRAGSFLMLGNFVNAAGAAANRGASDNKTAFSATTEVANGGDGMCLGCHGIPTGTHPTTGSTVSKTNALLKAPSTYSPQFATAVQGAGTAFYPSTDQMTCASCHDVHNANNGAAYFILKDGYSAIEMGSGTPTLATAVRAPTGTDYTDLCAACHFQYR